MDVSCFCGCCFSCAGNFGTCPGCGAYVDLSGGSDAEEKQKRAQLHLLLTDAAAAGRLQVCDPLGAPATESEFSNDGGAGAPRSDSSAPESRYV
jgi:hypothetical protein